MPGPETPRILSVEDNPETRFLLDYLLKSWYDLTLVPSVDSALEVVEDEQYDLLLLDINLGKGKDGTDLLHMIREEDEMEDVPAIALTAFAMPGDREDLLSSGFDEYVSKPFTRPELLEAIDQTLSTTNQKPAG